MEEEIKFGRIEDGDNVIPVSEEKMSAETGVSVRDMKIIIRASMSTYYSIHRQIEDICKSGEDIEAGIYRWLAKLPSVVVDKKILENL